MLRRLVPIVAIVLTAACADEEPAPTTLPDIAVTTTAPAPTTTSSVAETTTTVPVSTTTSLAPLQGLAYQEVAALDFPVQIVPRDEASSFVATKDGRVWAFDGSAVSSEPVLDISDLVRNRGEQGLLSIVFHPEDTSRLFVHYTAHDGDTVVVEHTVAGDATVDPEPTRQLLRLDQPARNHNGGMLQFGPDGHLYLGLGDGGGANDQFGNGQNTETLLAGLVRFNVEDPESQPVLFQYGLRNPWRFWIDGELVYIGDVGQNAYEEVNVAPLEEGVNHGWPIMEGLHCFRTTDCDTSGLTLPVIEVEHGDAGTCSITGGVVYHGAAIPELDGHFFYSDYCGGYLRSFLYRDGAVVEQADWTDQVGTAGRVTSFGVDFFGEMYVMTTDQLLKVVPVRAG